MLTLKVVLSKAEAAKKFLLDNKNYNKKYLPKKAANHIFFPVLKKIKMPSSLFAVYEQAELEKSKKKPNYKDILKNKLSKAEFEELPNSYDIIGNIIVIEIRKPLVKHEKLIGSALLKTHKNIKTVLKKSGIHFGEP